MYFCRLKMTVTFVLKLEVPNHNIETSDYINNLLTDLNVNDISVDVTSKFASVFVFYLDFLNHVTHDINDINTLLECFDMESYFVDDTFFKYLMFQAYPMWKDFYPHISDIPDKSMAYLYCPHEFVPNNYMNKPEFFKLWLKINQNVYVVLNHDEIYYTETEYYDNGHIGRLNVYMVDAHNKKRLGTGYRFIQGWYENGGLETRTRYINGWVNGVTEGWYERNSDSDSENISDNDSDNDSDQNGQLRYRYNYVKGKKQGLQENWYENGQIEYQKNYDDEEFNGLQTNWYNNGQLEYQRNYVDGKLHGVQIGWFENGELNYKSLYDMGSYVRNLLPNQ